MIGRLDTFVGRLLRAAGVAWIALSACIAGSAAGTPGGIGGTGIDPGGIGGTGIVAIGPIQRFGSIFVNGGEYELPPYTRYVVDGQAASAPRLHRGDMVTVQAQRNGQRLDALEVAVEHAVVGRITHVDRAAARLTVLGQTIVLTPSSLLRDDDDQPLSLSELAPGDVVRISALHQTGASWQALRLTRLPRPAAGHAAPLLLRGRLDAVDAAERRVRVGGEWLALGAQPLPADVQTGQQVIVQGRQNGTQSVVDSLRRAGTALTLPVGARLVLVAYVHQEAQGLSAQGFTLQGADAAAQTLLREAAAAAQSPSVLIGTVSDAHTVVVQSVVPRVDPMQFTLPPSAAQPSAAPGSSTALPGGTAGSVAPGAVSLPAVPPIPAVPQPGWVPMPLPAAPQLPAVNAPTVVPPAAPVIMPPSVAPVAPPAVPAPVVNPPTVAPPAPPAVPPGALPMPSLPRP